MQTMGWYTRQVLPRVVGSVCSTPLLDPWRMRACRGLEGEVVELGTGSGPNLRHLPATVTRLVAVEPNLTARRLCAARNPGAMGRVEFMDMPDVTALVEGSFDHALCTFTLCSVDDPVDTLTQLWRAVRPGGSLRLVEHGLAPDDSTARWQRRLDPWERRLAGGCSLSNDPVTVVRSTPWRVEEVEQGFVRAPRPWGYLTFLVASRSVA